MKKVVQVFWQFFCLGWISFGGPAAHIGYFEKTFVEKLKWLDAERYARLISLSQFLPGPGSSQIGFAIGLQRAGIAGAFAAFIAFTTPSVLLLYWLATTTSSELSPWLSDVTHGLKLLAVVVVADATLNMYKNFCQERRAITICVLTAATLLLVPSLLTQLLLLIAAAVFGIVTNVPTARPSSLQPPRALTIKWLPLVIFALLFAGLPMLTNLPVWGNLFADFYQSGSLVFGGGHVVLPLLQQTLGEAISNERFLLGYAAAQAVPGPMFSLAAFLGADLLTSSPLMGALIATVAIFLPGFLLVLAFHDSWESLAAKPHVAGAVWGVNAAVVGLLLAALYNPVFSSAVTSGVDMALVVLGFYALRCWKLPIMALVGSYIVIGLALPWL